MASAPGRVSGQRVTPLPARHGEGFCLPRRPSSGSTLGVNPVPGRPHHGRSTSPGRPRSTTYHF